MAGPQCEFEVRAAVGVPKADIDRPRGDRSGEIGLDSPRSYRRVLASWTTRLIVVASTTAPSRYDSSA
jgi:hypothetical protein